MTTPLSELEQLVDELTIVAPPPDVPMGLNFVIPRTGRWRICRVGAGAYAVRAEYESTNGGTQLAKMDGEITGYPSTIASALRFSIALARSHRHYWSII